MATNVWRGGAVGVSQVTTATVGGTVEVGDVFTLTVNAKPVSFVATATTTTSVATGLSAAWNASTVTEHQEATATVAGSVVTLTGKTAGVPFTVTASTTESGGGASDGQTLVIANPTAATGPNDWANAANWSLGALPANGDDVVVPANTPAISYGLGQSAVTLSILRVSSGYGNRIGLPDVSGSQAGGGGYSEYRTRYLAIGATDVFVGVPGDTVGASFTTSGGPTLRLDTGSVQTTLRVYGSGTGAAVDGSAGVAWKGTHASNVATVTGGSLAVATGTGEAATVATLTVQGDGSAVTVGSGVTLTTLTQRDGDSDVRCAATTLTALGGSVRHSGTGAITTLTVGEGGDCSVSGTGTVTTLVVGGGGACDFGAGAASQTVTTATLYANGTLTDPGARVTWTNGITVQRCSLDDVTLDVGVHRKVSISAGV